MASSASATVKPREAMYPKACLEKRMGFIFHWAGHPRFGCFPCPFRLAGIVERKCGLAIGKRRLEPLNFELLNLEPLNWKTDTPAGKNGTTRQPDLLPAACLS